MTGAEALGRSGSLAVMITTMRDAAKLKKVMLKRGLTAAKAPCPECDGMVNGRLSGPKKHMRFWCDGPCKRRLLE